MTGNADVVVVGAGFAGVLAAIELREAGRDVVVIERADRVGGTWRENVYPGVACDVPSHVYSLTRHPSPDWSAEFAPGAEIAAYLERVVDDAGIRPLIRFGSELTDAAWDESAEHWQLAFSGQGPATADVLVLACGRLAEPRVPDVAGLASFPGPVMHTARWDPSVPVAGTRIAVVGTGSSAAQLVPELVSAGADVVLFQRSAAWVLPRGGRAYTDAERAALRADPARMASLREELSADDAERFAARSGQPGAATRARRAARAHLAAQVHDRRLRRQLTPTDPLGCKRVVLSDVFYPAVASHAVELEPSALVAVDGTRLIGASGSVYDGIDRIVLATGFSATEPPYAHLVRGEGGVTLAAHWSRGMTAVATTAVAGFPNMFVLNGPNSALAHASSLLVLERQAAFVREMTAHRGVVRALPDAERAHSAAIDARAAGTPWTAGCRSWYRDDRSGRVTTLWPGTVADLEEAMTEAAQGAFAVTIAQGAQ